MRNTKTLPPPPAHTIAASLRDQARAQIELVQRMQANIADLLRAAEELEKSSA